VKGTFTPELSNMLGTPRKRAAMTRRPLWSQTLGTRLL
jgi:hypothetical protein